MPGGFGSAALECGDLKRKINVSGSRTSNVVAGNIIEITHDWFTPVFDLHPLRQYGSMLEFADIHFEHLVVHPHDPAAFFGFAH